MYWYMLYNAWVYSKENTSIHQTHTGSWSLVNWRALLLRWVFYKRLMHINEMARQPWHWERPWWPWLKFSVSNVIPWQTGLKYFAKVKCDKTNLVQTKTFFFFRPFFLSFILLVPHKVYSHIFSRMVFNKQERIPHHSWTNSKLTTIFPWSSSYGKAMRFHRSLQILLQCGCFFLVRWRIGEKDHLESK